MTGCSFHETVIDAPGHGDRPRPAHDEQEIADLYRARPAGRPSGREGTTLTDTQLEHGSPRRGLIDERDGSGNRSPAACVTSTGAPQGRRVAGRAPDLGG